MEDDSMKRKHLVLTNLSMVLLMSLLIGCNSTTADMTPTQAEPTPTQAVR